MRIIGAGFGRTGTLSLKVALERLGVGPCYHMTEVFAKPEHIELWRQLVDGESPDRRATWDAILSGYGSAVDWPACSFWRELMEIWPGATVLLSERDPVRWHESVMSTIYQPLSGDLPPGAPDAVRAQMAMARKLVVERTFGGRLHERDHAIAVFEAHNEEVKRTVPPERLLVYRASEGWEPLCRVLDVPAPDEPFPRVNTTEDFQGRMRAVREADGAEA